jgi:hypothetical protein
MKCSICGKNVTLISEMNQEDSFLPVCEECKTISNSKHEDAPSSESKPVCRNHPQLEADFKCVKCGTFICKTCVFPQPDGTSLCPDCMMKSVTKKSSPSAAPIPEGTMCRIHPGVPAVQICQMCQTPICKTCDFEFPDNIHICPNCVNKPLTLSPRQKKNLAWSYVMAVVATLGYFFNMYLAVVLGPDMPDQVRGFIFMLTVLGPSIAGLSFAINARTRNRKKTLSVWISLIWNSLIICLFLILVIVGILMG